MTRAEQRALEAYPVKMVDGPIGYEESIFDFNALLRYIFQEGYEQAEKDLTFIAQISSGPDGFFYGKGYQQAKKDLSWHPSTEHPPVDEEVIVLTDIITKGGLNAGFGKIAFGHIVDKDIAIDYDGWNIEGVRYWMPMPEIPKEEKK